MLYIDIDIDNIDITMAINVVNTLPVPANCIYINISDCIIVIVVYRYSDIIDFHIF